MGPFKEKEYNYIYKIVCIVTGKYYFGMHSTNKLDDNYIGSGQLLKKSILKYGRKNHVKTIVQFYNNRLQLETAEKLLITENLLSDNACLNLKTGGEHGCKFSQEILDKLKKTPEQKLAASLRRRGKPTFVTFEQCDRQSKLMTGENNPMHHSKRVRPQEWCENHSKTMKEKYSNGKSPLIGKPSPHIGKVCCIHPISLKTKTIDRNKIHEYESADWIIGKRKLNRK